MGFVWLDVARHTWDERVSRGKREILKTISHLSCVFSVEKFNSLDVSIIYVTNPASDLFHRALSELNGISDI